MFSELGSLILRWQGEAKLAERDMGRADEGRAAARPAGKSSGRGSRRAREGGSNEPSRSLFR